MVTFDQLVAKSDSIAQVLVQVDIGNPNVQWVNYGAGIWMCNFDNTYGWIDATLLDGFSAQDFAAVGSIYLDGGVYTQSTLELLWSVATSWYYDTATKSIYIHVINNDEIFLHQVTLGIVYGFTYGKTAPLGTESYFDGRLTGSLKLSKKRDPLFYGKLAYVGGRISLLNSDGELDTWGEDEDIYGNQVRVYYGFSELNFSDFKKLFVGYVDKVIIGEDIVSITVQDLRKQLTKKVSYSCTAKNAFTAVKEVLTDNYPVEYNETFFDTTAWALAEGAVDTITLIASNQTVISIVESVCSSIFGIMNITPDGRYSAKTAQAGNAYITIDSVDVKSSYTLEYDPSKVVSSVIVGHSKDWATTGTAYTYYEDTSRENAVILKYKTPNEETYDTLLTSTAQAATFADTILNYSDTVFAETSIVIPMRYWAIEVMDYVQLDVRRETVSMIGVNVFEVTGKTFNFDKNTITLSLRKSKAVFDLREIHTGDLREIDDSYDDRYRLVRRS